MRTRNAHEGLGCLSERMVLESVPEKGVINNGFIDADNLWLTIEQPGSEHSHSHSARRRSVGASGTHSGWPLGGHKPSHDVVARTLAVMPHPQ